MVKKNKVVYDSLVERDKKIIDLINQVGVITREQVQRVLFKNTHMNVPMRRLSHLAENKLIRRDFYQVDAHKNAYVYYLGKKPSKRNIRHEIMVSEFITKVMTMCDVLDVKTHYVIGDIIADAYIKYKDSEGKVRRLFLEVQLSNKVNDCVSKYQNIKNIILEEKPRWSVIPRLIVITDLKHNNEQLKGMRIKYDTAEMNNLREILF